MNNPQITKMSEKPYNLEKGTTVFAKDVIQLCQKFSRSIANTTLTAQLLRSASSVGANYLEATEALSKKDFIHRIRIARKECKESTFLKDGNAKEAAGIDSLAAESRELRNTFSAIIFCLLFVICYLLAVKKVQTMPRTARFLQDHCCYHVIINGPGKLPVFRTLMDYAYYLRLLKTFKMKLSVHIFAFCLLPERVHLIIQPKETGGLSAFMQRISQSYAVYFNRKYKREGKLWQGRFRSIVIGHDQDLFDCIKYVEWIPVRSELVNSPVEYPWSSCSLRVLGYQGSILDARSGFEENEMRVICEN